MSKAAVSRFFWPVVGHQGAINYLQQVITVDRVSHAYIFAGPAHSGKTTVAQFFVQSLLCQAGDAVTPRPCGTCRSCRDIVSGIHPDVAWLNESSMESPGTQIGVEQIRELQHRLALGTFLNSYKVAVIENAERLSDEACNAFLKTVEEPTGKAVIILITTSVDVLPATIVSRCQCLRFSIASRAMTVDYLVEQGCSKTDAERLAAVAAGRIGIAQALVNDHELFERADRLVSRLVTAATASVGPRLQAVKSIIGDGYGVREVIAVWQRLIRDALLIHFQNKEQLSYPQHRPALEQLGGRYSAGQLNDALTATIETSRYLEVNVSPRLVLENLLLTFSVPAQR